MQYWLPSDLSCSEHLSHKRSLDRNDFDICNHLWVVLFIVLWFCLVFFPSVRVHEGGIAGPDSGNNPAGSCAATEIDFSHLT